MDDTATSHALLARSDPLQTLICAALAESLLPEAEDFKDVNVAGAGQAASASAFLITASFFSIPATKSESQCGKESD